MNLTWFAKQAVPTAFLGRLGDLQLAASTLGYSFANVTGFAVLSGLCGAMEPICGQAHGVGKLPYCAGRCSGPRSCSSPPPYPSRSSRRASTLSCCGSANSPTSWTRPGPTCSAFSRT